MHAKAEPARKCHVIAVVERKGGVGKTTTALCLADALADSGKECLMVDLDQQHNASTLFGAAIEGAATAFDILTNRGVDPASCVQHLERGDIVAGDDWLMTAEEKMLSLDSREYLLSDALDKLKGDYDFVLIDCPTSLGLVVKNALVAADALIAPVMCDAYSDGSFEALMRFVGSIRSNRRLNPGLEVAGILVTQYERGQKLSCEYDEQLPLLAAAHGTRVFDTRIRRCVAVRRAQRANKGLFEFAPKCTAALDYRAFADELLDYVSDGGKGGI